MVKFKIWYYTTIRTEDNKDKVYNSFPEEIEHEGKKRTIRLIKDSYEEIRGSEYIDQME